MSLNKATLIGRLGGDPELRTTKNGKNVCHLNVATGGKGDDKTEWHKVIVWDKQAENAVKYLKKGSQVYIEGRIQTRSWEDKGEKRYATEISASVLTFLDSAGDKKTPSEVKNYDDIPF